MTGELVTADWQIEVRSLLTGPSTPYQIGDGAFKGWGNPAPKTNDADLFADAGAYLGRDYGGVRVLTFPYAIEGLTPADAGSKFRTLASAWDVSQTTIALHTQVPGWGHVAFWGRPRGLLDDLSDLSLGHVRALATWVCGDPTMYVLTPPTIGTATAGAGTATANWSAAPSSGSPIVNYVAGVFRASDGAFLTNAAVGPSTFTYTFTGRTPGVPVYMKVTTLHAIGYGPLTPASNSVIPS